MMVIKYANLALRFLLELCILAIASLAAASQPELAWAFGLVYVINRVLIYVWG